jgi:8-oxo-dGTP pyrophosphatase MutT (NUDIX family)
MTSRDIGRWGRWIIPKGNFAPRATPAEAATQEACEEVGVRGKIGSSQPLGIYTYFKKLVLGEARAAVVEVYLLRVKKHVGKWPEKGEGQPSWLSPRASAGLGGEPGWCRFFGG